MPSKTRNPIDFWATGDGVDPNFCRVCGRGGGDDLIRFGGQRPDHVHIACGYESSIAKWLIMDIEVAKKEFSKQDCLEHALTLTRKVKDKRRKVTFIFRQELEEKLQRLQKEKAECVDINNEIKEKMPEFPKHPKQHYCYDDSDFVFQDPSAACRVCGERSEPVLHFTGLEETEDDYVHFECAQRDGSEWKIVSECDIRDEHGFHWRAVKLALAYTRSAGHKVFQKYGEHSSWRSESCYFKREFEKNLSIAAEIYPKTGRRKKSSAGAKRKAPENAAELENVRPHPN